MVSPHMPKTSGHHMNEDEAKTYIVKVYEPKLHNNTRGGICEPEREHNLCRADDLRERVMDKLDDYEVRLISGIHNARKFDPNFDVEFAQFMAHIWDGIMCIMDEYGYEKE